MPVQTVTRGFAPLDEQLGMKETQWSEGIVKQAVWLSGMVESGGKQFKARFCGPGMRWSRSGAQNLLPVRTAILSHRFDQRWHTVYNSPIN